MRSCVKLFAMAVLAFAMTCPAQAAEAAKKMTLYMNGAVVTEHRALDAKNGEVRFMLPASADASSVRLSAAGFVVSELASHKVPARQMAEGSALMRQVEDARAGVTVLQGRARTLEARLAMWQEPRPRISDVEQLKTLDAVIAERSAAIQKEQAALAAELKQAKKALARLEARLSERGTAEEIAEVSAWVADARGMGVNGKIDAVLTYSVANCGWQPMMRVNARTDAGIVEITRLAVVRQKTGMDWKGVDLTLSTVAPVASMTPRAVSPWRIVPMKDAADDVRRRASGSAMERAVMNEAAMRMAPEPMPVARKYQAPVLDEKTVSQQWKLGERDLPAGTPVSITLDMSAIKASFVRVLRPKQESVSYLAADVDLDKSLDIPSGNAQYLVDGIEVGKQMFSFSGKKGVVYFGPDRAVTATMEADKLQGGTQGFIGKKQTYEWQWTITVKNAHAAPVDVRVEDALPQTGDKAIVLAVKSEPQAETADGKLVWKMQIPSGEQTIRHHVGIEAPADMRLRKGR